MECKRKYVKQYRKSEILHWKMTFVRNYVNALRRSLYVMEKVFLAYLFSQNKNIKWIQFFIFLNVFL